MDSSMYLKVQFRLKLKTYINTYVIHSYIVIITNSVLKSIL